VALRVHGAGVRKSIAPWAALGGSLVLTLAAAAFVRSTGGARDRARFGRAVRTTGERITARIDLEAALLRGAAALLAADPATDAPAFHRFATRLRLESLASGLRGMGYARAARRGESGKLETELQQRFAGVRIWPDQGREERSAVIWLEPLDEKNAAAIGYDMLTDPVRREAMERARDQAGPALTGKLRLVQDTGPDAQPGFLLYCPVYRTPVVPAGLAERRAQLIGWTYGAFRATDFFAGIFGQDPDSPVRFRLYDGDAEDPARLLYESRPAEAGSLSERTVHMEVGGRQWTLAFTSLRVLDSGAGPAALALVAGLLISLVIFLLSLREANERRRAEAAAAAMRGSLEERTQIEGQLREEGRVNSILRRLGIALAAELDPQRLAQLVADEASALTGAELGAMFDRKARRLALSGTLSSRFADLSLQRESPLVQRTLRDGQAVRTDDISKDGPVFDDGAAQVRGYLAVPVVSRTGEVLAGLFLAHCEAGHFTDHHERLLLGLAAQASIALDNARLLRDLQDADRRKDEFLAVLGHELRNPLAPVVTALEVARRDPSSAPRQLQLIERQTRHMVRIVDDLLDVSRISRGKIELRRQPLEVGEALSRAAESAAPLARTREQVLSVTPPAEPLVVDADPVRLDQILGNLLSNAIKYTPPGGQVALSAELRGGALCIEVSDTGIGIPAESQKSLFDPFVQVPGAKDYSTGGLGIGLALVRGLVELHGGTVTVRSGGAGKGSVFTVTLPGVREGRAPSAPPPPAPRASPGRVLVVDDNVDAALTLAEAVRFDGHEVRVAHEGTAALREAEAFSPEVVLLDIGLPGLDGYEIARRLRKLPQLARTLIVALTGFGQRSDRERALQAGFDEHLVKPVELDTVQAVLRRRLGSAG
jgi:signal transduction histidine kinase/CHASE1-domain containing sensor protein